MSRSPDGKGCGFIAVPKQVCFLLLPPYGSTVLTHQRFQESNEAHQVFFFGRAPAGGMQNEDRCLGFEHTYQS